MKVYNQNGNKAKRGNSAAWYVVLMVATVALIALSITLAVANTARRGIDSPASGGVEEYPPVTTKPTEYVLPFSEYTVFRQASLDKLVYMPSVNMWKTHNGVDFLPGKNDDVKVMADGKVTGVEQSSLEGWVVTVDHGDGIVSYYKSLSGVAVKQGTKVNAGDVIGKAGKMITESDVGNHVHIEITKHGELVDPLDYLNTDTIK